MMIFPVGLERDGHFAVAEDMTPQRYQLCTHLGISDPTTSGSAPQHGEHGFPALCGEPAGSDLQDQYVCLRKRTFEQLGYFGLLVTTHC